MDLIIQLGWLGGACLAGDDSSMAEGLPSCTQTHTHTHLYPFTACILFSYCRSIYVSFPQKQPQEKDGCTHTCVQTPTDVCVLQLIQTQWTLEAQLAGRQRAKWCKKNGIVLYPLISFFWHPVHYVCTGQSPHLFVLWSGLDLHGYIFSKQWSLRGGQSECIWTGVCGGREMPYCSTSFVWLAFG